jgi:thiamine pyrophosphokinase
MQSQSNRAVLFVNGDVKNYTLVQKILLPDDFIIAVDGGLRHVNALHLTPDLLMGDLDSVSEEEVADLRVLGVQVEQYPREKNETDLELALSWAVDKGFRIIRIVAGLGGRLDQTLGNLCLLMLPRLATCDLRMEDGMEEVFMIRKEWTVTGEAGDTISLLPLNEPASGVLTDGLYYPLKQETLLPEHTRGISNTMLGKQAHINLDAGTLLCIHTRINKTEEK